ncbi:MAG TPA: PEGA domain-containing protein [Kofleriaceae bacterium]|nr:PEGA domain-containing protein [Kofleriaceae bacterium]
MMFVRAGLLVLALAGTALAQRPSPEVVRHFQAGVDAFRLGKYDDAKVELEKARALDPKLAGPHRFLAAVAKAQQRWDDCIAAARTALALNPKSQELADTRKLHDDCRVAAGRPAYRGELVDSAAIAVSSNVTGATVRIGGLAYGGTPLGPRPITAGTLVIDVDKAGWQPFHAEVEAIAGIVTDVAAELAPAPGAPDRTLGLVTGTLVFPALPADAAVTIDGKPTTLPSDGRLVIGAGAHAVRVTRPGHTAWENRIVVGAGADHAVTPTLVATERRSRLPYLLVGAVVVVAAAGVVAYVASRDDGGASARVTPWSVTPVPGGAVVGAGIRW